MTVSRETLPHNAEVGSTEPPGFAQHTTHEICTIIQKGRLADSDGFNDSFCPLSDYPGSTLEDKKQDVYGLAQESLS